MNKPLVSIVVCTYNGEKYIKEQLDSLINQTYPNIEIIICDDNSNDCTIDIVKEYQKHYSNIFLYQNKENLGINKNMENGFLKSNGKYISPCDQDDVWELTKTEKLVNLIEYTKLQLVYCDGYLTDSNLNKIKKESETFKFYKGKGAVNLIFNNCVSGHGMLFNKKLLKKALPLPTGKLYYDYWLAIHALCFDGIDYVDEPLVKFRRHENAATLFKKTPKIEIAIFQNIIYKEILTCKYLNRKDKSLLKTLIQSNNDKLAGIYSFSFIKIFMFYGKFLRRKNWASNLVFALKNAKSL